ncbi:MAG: hypothetical protein HWE33_02440 [Rhodobacteraceae bacterium]|nr:hypothetical protein [Paracoccaceae bacterium]
MFGLDWNISTLSAKRRETEFSPASLAGLVAWYDASDLSALYQDTAMTTAVTQTGDPVAAMLDKSGNGNHMTQTSAAARPLYGTNTDQHWLAFDGVDDFMSVAAPISDYSFTMVVAVEDVGSSRGLATLNQDGSRYWSIHAGDLGDPTTYRVLDRQGAATTYETSQNVPSGPAVVLGQWISGETSISVDNATFSSVATSGTYGPAVDLRLCSFRAGNFTVGKVQSLAVYDRVLTASERTLLVSFMAQKQGRSLV